MTSTNVFWEIVYPALLVVALPIGNCIRNRFKAFSKTSRYKLLKEMDDPDYTQKVQRKVFTLLGASLYFLGASLVFSASRDPGFVAARITFAVVAAVAGAMAGANAKTVNEYGVKRQRQALREIDEKELKAGVAKALPSS